MTEQQNDHQKGKGVTYTERWLAEGLLRLTPRRTYIREEVESLMATLTGVVIEGMPLLDYRIEEAPLWFEVMVNLEDWSIEGGVSNDIWHFFKAAREQNTSGENLFRNQLQPSMIKCFPPSRRGTPLPWGSSMLNPIPQMRW